MSKGDAKQIVQLAKRFPELQAADEARRTWSWFQHKMTEETFLDQDWHRARSCMGAVETNQLTIRLENVLHDFWICKRANPAPRPENRFLSFGPDFEKWSEQTWQPPPEWNRWPTFDSGTWLTSRPAVETKALRSDAGPTWHSNASAERGRAMRILFELAQEPTAAGALMISQVAAWIDTALGRIGRLNVQPSDEDIDPGILIQDLEFHILPFHSNLNADIMEDCLEILYGSVRDPRTGTLIASPSPRGQSLEWRDYFKALGADISGEHALMSVQLAALALRSEAVWLTLAALRDAGGDSSADENRLLLATCIRRRWFLAIRALVWLEISLQRQRPFTLIRPPDLACFAIGALLPHYPRPLVAVSHRSLDAKERLFARRAWGANEVLLDATFRPEWQTNRAMVWSLFASTPVLCMLRSPNYEDSFWCRLESEMFSYLVETADFFEGRRYIELELSEVDILEEAARSSLATHRFLDAPLGLDLPPLEVRAWHSWQGAMVRAVAIARFAYRFLTTAKLAAETSLVELANRWLALLYAGDEPAPQEALLGIDHFWQQVANGMRADAKAVELAGPLAKVVKAEKPEETEAWFRRLADIELVSNPRKTALDPCDLLAAIDWRQYLEPFLRDHTKGTRLENQAGIIDLRGTTEAAWTADPGWTVARGLIFLRLPYPLIVRQEAGQGVESWPLLRELDIPIFTQHSPNQRLPHSEVFFSIGGSWPALYHEATSELVEMSPSLADACRETLGFGRDPVMMRFDGGLSALSI